MPALPRWRSLLYVPVTSERFVAKAHTRGADAIILELEDAVAPSEKERARGLVTAAAETSPGGEVALFGVSAGATLALLAAADEQLAPTVRIVAAVAPAGDMRRGQSLVVWSIREGRQCARAVDEFLMGFSELPR